MSGGFLDGFASQMRFQVSKVVSDLDSLKEMCCFRIRPGSFYKFSGFDGGLKIRREFQNSFTSRRRFQASKVVQGLSLVRQIRVFREQVTGSFRLFRLLTSDGEFKV